MRHADAQTRRRAVTLAALGALWLIAACSGDKRKRVVVQPPKPETVYVNKPVPAARPAPLEVSPTRVDLVAIGDTARILTPAGASCAIASEDVARMDSLFVITAVANGDTHVRCWQEGHTATIKVHVQQQVSHVLVVADKALELGRAGDSIHLQLNRTDSRGAPVATNTPPVWTSLTPQLVSVDAASGLATSVADSGIGKVVGQAEGFADTVLLSLGPKGASTKGLSRFTNTANARARALAAAARAAQVTEQAAAQQQGPAGFVQAPVGQTVINARSPRLADSLFIDPSLMGGLQRLMVPSAFAAVTERIHDDGSFGSSLEKHSGVLFGGGLDIMTRGPLSFRFQFATGTLTGDTAATAVGDKTMTVSEGAFEACLAIAPWLTVIGGTEARTYTTSAGTGRWAMIGAGAEADFNLGGGPLYGYASGMVLPITSVATSNGTSTAPTFGLQAALGVGYESPRLSARLLYSVEHFSFPATTTAKEQFAQLVFRFGYKFSW